MKIKDTGDNTDSTKEYEKSHSPFPISATLMLLPPYLTISPLPPPPKKKKTA